MGGDPPYPLAQPATSDAKPRPSAPPSPGAAAAPNPTPAAKPARRTRDLGF
jgi:hypothetical protein